MNESIFLVHTIFISAAVLGACKIGKQALTALFCLLAFVANLFLFKQIDLLGLVITCTDAYAIGCFFSLGLIQHYYGDKAANDAISLCFYLLIFLTITSQIHLLYCPSRHDTYQSLYEQLFATTPRILLSSLLVGFTSQKICIFLQQTLSKKYPRASQVFLIATPIALAQAYDTIFFSVLALYGLMHSLIHLIIMSYLVKLAALVCVSPFIALSKKLQKVPSYD
jgi:uncharacterized integral membrane protein (TIGR00697 family)